jgi:hypothetical protein
MDASARPSGSVRQPVGRVRLGLDGVQVVFGRGDAGVAHQALDGAQVNAGAQQGGAVGVPQAVGDEGASCTAAGQSDGLQARYGAGILWWSRCWRGRGGAAPV